MINFERYQEICKTITEGADSIIKQYADKPVGLRSSITRDYDWKTNTQYIRYYTDISLLDENEKTIFGTNIDISLRKGLLEVSTGTTGSFTKENYGQYNKYVLMGKLLENIDKIESEIKSIIETYKDEFNKLEDEIRDERIAKDKAEREVREQERITKIENAENECRKLAEEKQVEIRVGKLITVKRQFGATRCKNWIEALNFVKSI